MNGYFVGQPKHELNPFTRFSRAWQHAVECAAVWRGLRRALPAYAGRVAGASAKMAAGAEAVPGAILQGVLGYVKRAGLKERYCCLHKDRFEWFNDLDAAVANDDGKSIMIIEMESIEELSGTITISTQGGKGVNFAMLPGKEAEFSAWVAALRSALEDSKAAAKQEGSGSMESPPEAAEEGTFAPGHRVHVATENGPQKGKLIEFDSGTGHWYVLLKDGSTVSVAPEAISRKASKSSKRHGQNAVAEAFAGEDGKDFAPILLSPATSSSTLAHDLDTVVNDTQHDQQLDLAASSSQDGAIVVQQKKLHEGGTDDVAVQDADRTVQDEHLDVKSPEDKFPRSETASTTEGLIPAQRITQEAWLQKTKSTLSNAKEIKSRLQNKRQSATSNKGVTLQASVRQEEQVKRRIAYEKHVAENFNQIWNAMEHAQFKLHDVLARIQKATVKGAISVADKRLEVRGKRPPEEHVNDAFQQALKQERRKLAVADRDINVRVEEMKSADAKLKELKDSFHENRLKLTANRKEHLNAMFERARAALAVAEKAERDGDAVLVRSETEAKKMREATAAAMKKHIAETVELRRVLESELKCIQSSTQETERRLAHLSHRLLELGIDPQKPGSVEEEQSRRLRRIVGDNQEQITLFGKIRAKINASGYVNHRGKSMESVFAKLDKDGSGALDQDELRTAIRRVFKISDSVLTDPEIAVFCRRLDSDRSGTVSIRELMEFLSSDREVLMTRWKETNVDIEQLKSHQENIQAELKLKTAAWRIDECCAAITLSPAGTYQEMYDVAKSRIDHIDVLQHDLASEKGLSGQCDKASTAHSTGELSATTVGDTDTSATSSPTSSPKAAPRHVEQPAEEREWVDEKEWAARARNSAEASAKMRKDMDKKEQEAQRQFGHSDQVAARLTPLPGTAQAMEMQKRLAVKEKDIHETLMLRMNAAEEASFKVADLVAKLQRDRVRDALVIAEKKLEVRSTRPVTELTQDVFQVALIAEKKVLQSAGQALDEIVAEGRQILRDLDKARDEMLKKKLTLHLDRSHYPQELLENVQKAIDNAMQLCLKGMKKLEEQRNHADQAHAKTNSSMKQHLEHTQEFRKQLELEIKDNKVHITDTQKCLAKLKFDLENHAKRHKKEDDDQEPRPKSKVLDDPLLQSIRSRIKAAAYTGPGGRKIDEILRRYDKDGSGELNYDEFRSAVRRGLKVPTSLMSDAEISALGNMLDADKSGAIGIGEIKNFVEYMDAAALREQISDIEQSLCELEKHHEDMVADWRNKVAAWKLDEKCRLLVNAATQASALGCSSPSSKATSPRLISRTLESLGSPLSPQSQSPRSPLLAAAT